EGAVGKALARLGYDVIPQFSIGRYRVDYLVTDGQNSVIIECDGFRYHSTDDQIENDVKRQLILERMGWKFIRVPSTEYFIHPEKCIDNVDRQIQRLGISKVGASQVDVQKTVRSNLVNELIGSAAMAARN